MNGNFVGDPLEKELVRASGWVLNMGDDGFMHATPPHSMKGIASGKYTILRHFDFAAEKLRAASLIKRPTGEIVYVVKGSPEAIVRLSKKESIPDNLSQQLTMLGRRGYRVIALAYCVCTQLEERLMSSNQEEIEGYDGGVTYLGLAFLSSRLKNDTKSTMETLHKANIYTNMITGDHVFTAVAVARDCGLVIETKKIFIIDTDPITNELQVHSSDGNIALISDICMDANTVIDVEASCELTVGMLIHHLTEGNIQFVDTQLAMTGLGLQRLKELWGTSVASLVRKCQVFARMKPKDKKMIVEMLMQGSARRLSNMPSLDCSVGGWSQSSSVDTSGALLDKTEVIEPKLKAYKVIFCGDGANDMAALKASTVGVSLCDAETSVAAPVTSRLQTPGAVIEVIREGRASLITAYVLVNFNIMYAVIQLFMTCQLYALGLAVGDYMYLIQDLMYTLVLGICITLSSATTVLSVEVPPVRFFTSHLVMKLFSQLICFPTFQLITLAALNTQSWYVRFETDGEPLTETLSIEASALSTLALAQLMIASVASTIDEPYRKPWYKNEYHVGALLIQGVFVSYQLISRENRFTRNVLEVEPLPYSFCGIMVGIILCNCFVSGLLARLADCFK
eukprot:CAMPEP_0182436944 /NCGR_PEP_ID=MMETSP1167-20130531/84585_1 /TAXON_ID=2988 /ORGANISM="Mallomonas Sp, Strain CCMP3275" /LENGTH=623 /DNA_ID=CAMNT_0024629661 /DNA_START=613 /DNA_END=2484 /DNA_ORIENTATION=-